MKQRHKYLIEVDAEVARRLRNERDAVEAIKARIRSTIPPYRDPDEIPTEADR